ncbi:MAG TPA: hypothetical protein VLL72_11520, partial [Kiloniellales bacterium]|nr:hypothetical protein [Kiloniellales bacterium]
ALMLEANPSLAPADVYRILRDTAQPWGPGGTPNGIAGNGMVDGQAAVKAALGGAACMDYSPNPTPAYTSETGSVGRNGTVQVPIWIEDPSEPLAITMTIDGRTSSGIWSPDLDMFLLDANGQPYLVDNPLYPWFSSEPFVPAPGTSSTCTAGEDCGSVGAQETIHIALPPVAGDPVPDPDSINPHYFLEIRPWEGFPNRGKGGSFTLEFSNAHSDVSVAPPNPCVLTADAGPDQAVTDEDGDGFELVTLDGSGSTGGIASYLWTSNGAELGTGVTLSLPFALGEHSVMLTVSEVNGVSATDELLVTVKAPKGGGGKNNDGGGGGGGGGGSCKNPNKC